MLSAANAVVWSRMLASPGVPGFGLWRRQREVKTPPLHIKDAQGWGTLEGIFRACNRRSRCRSFRVGLHDQIVAANYAAALGFVDWGGGGNCAENVKQRGVGGDLQIEIENAVHQDAHTTEQ